MGTRSTITFVECYPEEDNKECPLVTIYQTFDGYVDGVGHTLANWLCKMTLINGMSKAEHYNNWEYANGAGCLVAKFIHDFKTETGCFYIESPDIAQRCDYNYIVKVNFVNGETPIDDAVTIIVRTWDEEEPIFVGTPSELSVFSEEMQ